MKSFNRILFFLLALVVSRAASATTIQDLYQRSHDASLVINEIQTTPDHAIPDGLLKQAKCVATFPSVIRVALILGGRFGRGLVSCKTPFGWSQASYLTMAGGSLGLQAGVDSTDVVMVFVRQNAVDRLSKGDFTLGADASVTAGPVGRDAEADTDYALASEIFGYSNSRGLFAGIALDGTAIANDIEANTLVYGTSQSIYDTLVKPAFVGKEGTDDYVASLVQFAR